MLEEWNEWIHDNKFWIWIHFRTSHANSWTLFIWMFQQIYAYRNPFTVPMFFKFTKYFDILYTGCYYIKVTNFMGL